MRDSSIFNNVGSAIWAWKNESQSSIHCGVCECWWMAFCYPEKSSPSQWSLTRWNQGARRLKCKSLVEIGFPKDSHNVFEWCDLEGEALTGPLHCIKDVYQNGELIWQRTLWPHTSSNFNGYFFRACHKFHKKHLKWLSMLVWQSRKKPCLHFPNDKHKGCENPVYLIGANSS